MKDQSNAHRAKKRDKQRDKGVWGETLENAALLLDGICLLALTLFCPEDEA